MRKWVAKPAPNSGRDNAARCSQGRRPRCATKRAWRVGYRLQRLLLCGLLMLGALPTIACGATQTWKVDTTGSHASFSVRVFWVHTIGGTFSRVGGHVDVLEAGRFMQVQAWIDARTVKMSKLRYQRWLLSPDFFDAQRFPRIRFMSGVAPIDELTHGGPLQGLVTIHGITRFVDFHLTPVNCRLPYMAPCVVRLSGHIQRSDFGMNKHLSIISDRVKLELSIELRNGQSPESPASAQTN